MGSRRRVFLCPATLLPLLLLSVSLNLFAIEVRGQGQSENDQGNEFADIEDNDFAEFDFEDETDESSKVDEEEEDDFESEEPEEEEAEVEVENEDDDEFSHFEDDGEFEGLNSKDDNSDPEEFFNEPSAKGKGEKQSTAAPNKQPIKIVNIPAHLRTNWENYYMEILMIVGIVVYFLNFFTGKTKNEKIANQWFSSHRGFLESQFSLVGDDGSKNIDEIQDLLTKESENHFSFWCSGRLGCEGMLVELRLLKRQDLVGVVANLMKPAHDQVHVRVELSPEDMDSFIFCLATKKSSARLIKELADISTYCPERRPADKYLGVTTPIKDSYQVMTEVPEVAAAMLDNKVVSLLKKFPDVVDTIHFSDQYTGPKPPEDQQPMELPKGKRVLIFVFNLLLKDRNLEEAIEETKPLMQLVFHCIDKVKRYKLSREAKAKADKNRSKVAENHWKSIHAAKAEKAAEEREKKRREVKDKIREIEDPDKQRKMEERENKRDKKKQQPKTKQLKVKSA